MIEQEKTNHDKKQLLYIQNRIISKINKKLSCVLYELNYTLIK